MCMRAICHRVVMIAQLQPGFGAFNLPPEALTQVAADHAAAGASGRRSGLYARERCPGEETLDQGP